MKELRAVIEGGAIIFVNLQDIPGVTLKAVGRKPTWRSREGFQEILNALAEALGGGDVARGRAVYALWLSARDEDISPALELPEYKAVQLAQIASPYGERFGLDLKDWEENWYRRGWSLGAYHHADPVYREGGMSPKTCILLETLSVSPGEFDKIKYQIKGKKKLTEGGLVDLLLDFPWGQEVKSKYGRNLSGRQFLNFFQGKIDGRYWDGLVEPISLLKAGVSIRDILDYQGINHSALTKKELGKLEFLILQPRQERWVSVTDILCNQVLGVGEYPWTRYTLDTAVWKWCLRHHKQLEKTRTVHGPGGQVVEVHVHTMVKYINSDILPRGEFTGWKHVEAAVEEAVRREIADQLEEDRPLPEFPLNLNDDRIVQVKTTHALRDEGARLNHCVGSYITACDRKMSYIFHVEDGTDLGATVEVAPRDGVWTIPQAMNRGNRHSPLAVKIMDDALAEALDNTTAKAA